MPFCPNCGKEVQQGTSFCPNCGRNLQSSSSIPPVPPTQLYNQNGLNSDASTAKTITLIAILLQLLFFALGLFAFLVFLLVAAVVPIFGIIFGLGAATSIIWLLLDYFLVYNNLKSQNTLPKARTPSIVLGIIQLILGGVIPGILLIIAYVKIGDSIQKMSQVR